MIFPIGDDQVKGGHFPVFSYSFIAINILVFLYQFSLGIEGGNQFIMTFGAVPAEVMSGQNYYSLFTSMFLHGSWMHLLGNMLFLWIFADNIEATIGPIQFVIFYIIGGLAAHAGHILLNMNSVIPTVGASGAIAAVMGAYLVMYPKSRIKTLIFFYVAQIPAFIYLLFWIGQQIFSASSELQSAGGDGAGVAWWAHIGGFVFGLVAGFYYRTTYLNNTAVSAPQASRYERDDLL